MKQLEVSSLLDLEQTIASYIFRGVTYPWEVISKINSFTIELSKNLSRDEFSEIARGVFASNSAKISSSSCICPPCIIDSEAEVRHGAFIRGSVIVGKNCVVGNSSELKNCILFNNVQVPHFNYIGDSVMGFKSHMGAGSIISNVKSDKSEVSVKFANSKIFTNLRKFGAIVGDFVEIGCNVVLNPGTIIGRQSNVYPLSMVRGYIGGKKILKDNDTIVDKL